MAGYALFVIQNHLYALLTPPSDDPQFLGGPTVLERMDLNGGNREAVYTFPATELFPPCFATDGRNFYAIAQEMFTQPSFVYQHTLFSLDLTTLERRDLARWRDDDPDPLYNVHLWGAAGGELYVTGQKERNPTNGKAQKLCLYAVSPKDGAAREIFVRSAVDFTWNLTGDKLLTAERGSGALTLTDVTTGEQLFTGNCLGGRTDIWSFTLHNLRDGFIYFYLFPKAQDITDHPQPLYQSLEIATGKRTDRTLWIEDNVYWNRTPVTIIDTYGDQYLVAYACDYENIYSPNPNGPPTSLPESRYTFAFISKDDYLHCRPVYTEIVRQ